MGTQYYVRYWTATGEIFGGGHDENPQLLDLAPPNGIRLLSESELRLRGKLIRFFRYEGDKFVRKGPVQTWCYKPSDPGKAPVFQASVDEPIALRILPPGPLVVLLEGQRLTVEDGFTFSAATPRHVEIEVHDPYRVPMERPLSPAEQAEAHTVIHEPWKWKVEIV